MSMFTPRAGDALTIVLPSEQLRAQVTRVIDRDTVIVEIGQPFMKTHNYRLGDLVACRRIPGVLGESWQAIEVRPTLPNFVANDTVSDDTVSLSEIPKPSKMAVSKSKTVKKPEKPAVSPNSPNRKKG